MDGNIDCLQERYIWVSSFVTTSISHAGLAKVMMVFMFGADSGPLVNV